MRSFSIFIAIAVILAMTGYAFSSRYLPTWRKVSIQAPKVPKVRSGGLDPDNDSFMQAPAGSFDTD